MFVMHRRIPRKATNTARAGVGYLEIVTKGAVESLIFKNALSTPHRICHRLSLIAPQVIYAKGPEKLDPRANKKPTILQDASRSI